MKVYLVNTTFSVYMLDIKESEIFRYVKTLNGVTEEVKHLRKTDINIEQLKAEKAEIEEKSELRYLSPVDLSLLQTAKSTDYVLVTDDRKLAKAAEKNDVMVLSTPRLISELAFDGIISYEEAERILSDLKAVYIRVDAIDKTIKNLKNWR